MANQHRVLIIGGGFAGLYAAKSLRKLPVEITLIDQRNFHLFQPLLYQVATGAISPGEIASPLRGILRRNKNTRVLMSKVIQVDSAAKKVQVEEGWVEYDTLIIATGVTHSYFGHDEWSTIAHGLKTVEDALEIRRDIYMAFERAEATTNDAERKALLTFAIIGGGPTGVEMAGALAELSRRTLRGNFRSIDPSSARILLLEADDRILPTYDPFLSAKATRSLEKLGVEVRTGSRVTSVAEGSVLITRGIEQERIPTRCAIWAAGVRASSFGSSLRDSLGAATDRVGRIVVGPDLSLPFDPSVFVIGDLAAFYDSAGAQLPGVAQVAMQQGRYVASVLRARLPGSSVGAFRFRDPGSIAVIGRNAAVFSRGRIKLWGWPAWFVWAFIHLAYLIEFDNKLLVLLQWAWSYLTFNRGARLIGAAEGERDY
ncbi:MAG: NAD(P)/FAD-dependent oxidoreductase [Fimbriimonadales bacterium]